MLYVMLKSDRKMSAFLGGITMKRKLICVLLCLLFVLSTFVVEAFAEKLNSEDVDWGISMKAEQVTPNGAVILVSQSGGNHTGVL